MKKYIPSKQELLRILNGFSTYFHPTVPQELTRAVKNAEKATAKFLKSNPEYLKLIKNQREATRSLESYKKRKKNEYSRLMRDCRNGLYMRGPVPSVVHMIQKFLYKYQK